MYGNNNTNNIVYNGCYDEFSFIGGIYDSRETRRFSTIVILKNNFLFELFLRDVRIMMSYRYVRIYLSL